MYIYLLSGDQFKIQTSFVLFWQPDIVNFHLKSLFIITLVQSKHTLWQVYKRSCKGLALKSSTFQDELVWMST